MSSRRIQCSIPGRYKLGFGITCPIGGIQIVGHASYFLRIQCYRRVILRNFSLTVFNLDKTFGHVVDPYSTRVVIIPSLQDLWLFPASDL